jgi:hypothetical protein
MGTAAGEVVIFDRSWYNRGGVERVMGFCTEERARRFLKMVPLFEKLMIHDGIMLIKYWLEVSPDDQTRRLEARIDDGQNIWKLSPMDLKSYTQQPGLVYSLIPWRRPAILAPLVNAVFAARDFFIHGTDDVPTSKEPMKMPVPKAPVKILLPSVEATPSSARLEAAVRKAASAKAKARDAKAALKEAKKGFRLARKAAKAARKEVDALQAAITRAEERAAAAAKRARATQRAPKTGLSRAAAGATPRPPTTPKPGRKTRRAAPTTDSGSDVVYTEALATPSDTFERSPSDTSS